MAVRRIAKDQPESFVFNEANLVWADAQIKKFPEGKQASAVIPLLWRAQEQHNGWLPEPAMRYIAEMLDMPFIRVMEVATFYTMFQLSPVGRVAHIQVCGTTPCMLRGSEDLIKVCKKRIAEHPHQMTEDGKFSWEEVECLGACVNAPMVQIFKDTFEDLTVEAFEEMLDDMENGQAVKPGPQTDRHLAVNEGGRTQLFEDSLDYGPTADPYITPYVMNGAAAMIASDARDFGAANDGGKAPAKSASKRGSSKAKSADKKKVTPEAAPTALTREEEEAEAAARLASLPKGASAEQKADVVGKRPKGLKKARASGADDLKQLKGVGRVIEGKLNSQGIWHFDQIAKWERPEVLWFDTFLSFKGRIDRDDWINQAKILADGGDTEFSKRVAKGEVDSSGGGPSGKAK